MRRERLVAILVLALFLVSAPGARAEEARTPDLERAEEGQPLELARAGQAEGRRKRRVRRRRRRPKPPFRSDVEGYYGFEAFLTQGKAMPGLTLGLQFDTFGFGGDLGMIYLTDDDDSGLVDGPWLGSFFGFQLFARLLRSRTFDVRLGTGFDSYWLWGVYAEEWQFGLPLIVEARFFPSRSWTAFVQARGYPLRSEGLEAGTNRNGHTVVPLLLVAGLGGW